jgi:hypothetical protein
VTANNNPQVPAQPQNLALTPVQTNQISLSWSAAAGAAAYIVNRGGLPVAFTTGTAYADAALAPNSYYCYSIVASNAVGFSTPSATACTNTPSTPISYAPFVLDGAADAAGYLLASSGMTLYAAVRGTTLYLATWSTGTNGPNDHFIFVADQLLPAATANAPWAKTGKVAVATGKPYLAAESRNAYLGWANAPAGALAAKADAGSGQMEGTLDLVAAFGSVPANLYLCAAAYQTGDGGALAAQCPAASGSGSSTDLEPGEFLVIPTAALADSNADGVFDRLDPALGFRLLSARRVTGGYALSWGAMPGHSYQVLTADSLPGGWTNPPGATTTAGPLQLDLGWTDSASTAATQRYYRIKLLAP